MARIDGIIGPLEQGQPGCPTAFLLSDFDIGCSNLKRLHRKLLERLGEILASNPDHRVRLVGRTAGPGRTRWICRCPGSGPRRSRSSSAASSYGVKVAANQIEVEFIGKTAPFSTDKEAQEDRSVEVHMEIAKVLTIVLENAHFVRPTHELVSAIREVFDPIVRTGRPGARDRPAAVPAAAWGTDPHLRPRTGRETALRRPDPGPGCRRDRLRRRPRGRRRVCGGVRGDADDPDFATQVDPIFDNGMPGFARFVANTAIHELGHIIANLPHSPDRFNFMTNEDLPDELRNRENLRRFYAARLHFDDDQIRRPLSRRAISPRGLPT